MWSPSLLVPPDINPLHCLFTTFPVSLISLVILLPISIFLCIQKQQPSVSQGTSSQDPSVSNVTTSSRSKKDGSTKGLKDVMPSLSIRESGKDGRAQWAMNIIETKNREISREFINELKDFYASGHTADAHDKYLDKNRYADMPCYDKTRVVLKQNTSFSMRKSIKGRGGKTPVLHSDYIHANWMNTPDGQKWIATQGPLAETVDDFWTMVIQEKVPIIIQLCKFVENDSEKCFEYWPHVGKPTMELNLYKVTLDVRHEDLCSGVQHTTLIVEGKDGGHKHIVDHIYVQNWPDQLSPSDATGIVRTWKWCCQKANKDTIIVHCSAGVGRTATFIGISWADTLLQRGCITSLVDVVKQMRSVRHKSVQTHVQYLFLHVCLVQLYMEMGMIKKSTEFDEYMENYKKEIQKRLAKHAPCLSI